MNILRREKTGGKKAARQSMCVSKRRKNIRFSKGFSGEIIYLQLKTVESGVSIISRKKRWYVAQYWS